MDDTELTISTGNNLSILNLPPLTNPEIAKEPVYSLLPYITLVQGQSPLAGPPHQIQAGNFIIHTGKGDFEVLGKEFDVFPLDMRYKATRWLDQRMTSVMDRESPLFREFQSNADNGLEGYRWGFEFLLYIGSLGIYATLYANNVSLRISASRSLVPRMRTVCTIKQDFIEGGKHKWWSFKAVACNESLAVPIVEEEAIEQIMQFNQESPITEPVAVIEDDNR